LSRTLVPTMVHYLLAREEPQRGALAFLHAGVNRYFLAMRDVYGQCLAWVLSHRRVTAGAFAAFVIASPGLLPLPGRDFFPTVDAGQIRLHVRCPPGTRVEETEKRFSAIEDVIRREIPPEELSTILDNMGIPVSGINLALGDPSMISAADGEIL